MTSQKSDITIKEIYAREILDSRGSPTVYARVTLANGGVGIASVPSGTSTGAHEAVELRDGDARRMQGRGVLKAVANIVQEIAPRLVGLDPREQVEIDQAMIELDGTANKARLGANAILAVSLAVLRSTAFGMNREVFQRCAELYGGGKPYEIPVPLLNILNGGVHANGSTDFQEFMVAPAGLETFSDALRAGSEIYKTLEKNLKAEGLSTNVGYEGGFAPHGLSNRQALGFITEAIEQAGYVPGENVFIALDPAASEFYSPSSLRYNLKREGQRLDSQRMINEYINLCKDFPIFSIEDGLAENDWDGWVAFTAQHGNQVQLVGDDLFVTQKQYIEQGIARKAANAVLIKPNQAGTVTETLEAIRTASNAGMGVMVSHRSGETEDTTIADLAVGTRARQIKSGAPARGERTAKYNRLLRIEEELGSDAIYSGPNIVTQIQSKRLNIGHT